MVRNKMSQSETNEPTVSVGIVSAKEVNFSLNEDYLFENKNICGQQCVEYIDGKIRWNNKLYDEIYLKPTSIHSSFTIADVTIGVNFHWERKEAQTFLGNLHLLVDNEKIYVINILPIECYLSSVISSEMKATSSVELLKAHAVISRSWLLAQISKRKESESDITHARQMGVNKANEHIIWYDRDDHKLFDVCADDHCQRYQGITNSDNPHVVNAIRETRGEILFYGNSICDARFSKCCGGITEEYQYCWENIKKPYLLSIQDTAHASLPSDGTLEKEDAALDWISSSPDAFCNTQDKRVLSQVLNNYDQETTDFFRWSIKYTQHELSQIIRSKSGIDFGEIMKLQPLSRGKSGRIYRLKIVGTKRTMIIGKELEIRRILSNTHLYSSAFIIEPDSTENDIPQTFTLRGAGWGHGVGLCQIGAAVMGDQGYTYREILEHYYKGITIKAVY